LVISSIIGARPVLARYILSPPLKLRYRGSGKLTDGPLGADYAYALKGFPDGFSSTIYLSPQF
jgi:hypothetical protein